jgi:hypothetical protein
MNPHKNSLKCPNSQVQKQTDNSESVIYCRQEYPNLGENLGNVVLVSNSTQFSE